MSEVTMRYLCVHCDLTFESADGPDARCPRCMRKGAVPRQEGEAKPKRGRVALVIGSVAVGLAVLGAGYAIWARTLPAVVGDSVNQGPLSARELRGHLERLHLDTPDNRKLFESGESVEPLLGEAADRGTWPERARAIARRFAALRTEHRLVAPDEHGHRRGAFLAPEALARSLGRGEGSTEAGSLELALLAVVALREHDVLARVAEIYALEGQGTPPDKSGTNGYYGVLVRRESGSREVEIIDIAGGGTARPTSVRRLDDVDAVAAALGVRAQIALARDRDGSGALATVDDAIRIDPQCIAPRTLRAALLSATGAIDEAIAEAEAAERLRPDAPRFVMHASLLVSQQRTTEAEALARRATAAMPDYGAAYGILAAVALSRRDMDAARSALDSVQAKDPEFDGLPLLWANFYLMSGDVERAVERLEAWVAARPNEPLVRLQAAHTLGMVGRQDAALGHLRAALAMVEGDERDAMREQIGQAFGPSVLAALIETGGSGGSGTGTGSGTGSGAGAGTGDEIPPPPSELNLGSPTLGGGRPNRPSLLGPRQ